ALLTAVGLIRNGSTRTRWTGPSPSSGYARGSSLPIRNSPPASRSMPSVLGGAVDSTAAGRWLLRSADTAQHECPASGVGGTVTLPRLLAGHIAALVVGQVEPHRVQRAGERVVHDRIVVGHRRRAVAADVERLVEREVVRNGRLDLALGDLLAVDEQATGAAAPDASALVAEVEHHLVPAGRQRLRRGDLLDAQAEVVVGVARLAVRHVERPPAEATALGDDHAVRAAFGHFHLGGD